MHYVSGFEPYRSTSLGASGKDAERRHSPIRSQYALHGPNCQRLTLMKDFVNGLESNNINAVKCLVYDGADAGRFTNSDAAQSS
eukprot:symbB.v1.2.028915.t1/scaffold3102.1/size63526/3